MCDQPRQPLLPIVALVVIVFCWPAAAQQVSPAARAPVERTAFNQPTPGAMPRQTVQFGRKAVRVGDRLEQTLALEVKLSMIMRRANEVVGKNQNVIRSRQQRVVTTTAVEAGRAMAVTVHYPESTKQVIGPPDPVAPAAVNASTAAVESPPHVQPVAGKTYHCVREPGESGKLVVTDEAGNTPPEDEYSIVAQQMEMVGRPNPFAEYLAGRTIAVGDKVVLPNELATQIFGLGDKFGEVTRFALTLQRVQPENGANCAVFLASVEAMSSDSSQMRMQVEGPLVVEVDSCRAVRIGLVGPIGMSETRGSYSTAYQVISTGRVRVDIASAFREAK